MAKKKITKDTEFVRNVSFTLPGGKKVSFVHQPYVTGIYVAGYADGKIAVQTAINWGNLRDINEKNMRKNIVDEATDIEITVSQVGKWLSESDIEIVNR
jgi:hypothetical protein